LSAVTIGRSTVFTLFYCIYNSNKDAAAVV
jgi:hypothetical protein